ncbi:hypothetical protein AVEN_266006-1 [Araneus ventricosus]|uniref:Uncharacterized protein n=1 Tax=Araneus ventricosus TaxID=182803 RepID=A0A4Y2MR39_ARAVE|nr:hypothetical protein AVEN_79768-1 [Araneus ventricosus]GBN30463.1 hypothetical protein AVEN_266006-1 [Araneus ventricosus]
MTPHSQLGSIIGHISIKSSLDSEIAVALRSRLRDWSDPGSKPDSTGDPPCMWCCCTLNLVLRVKRPPAGVEINPLANIYLFIIKTLSAIRQPTDSSRKPLSVIGLK